MIVIYGKVIIIKKNISHTLLNCKHQSDHWIQYDVSVFDIWFYEHN